MARNSNEYLNTLNGHLRNIDSTRKKVDSLLSKGYLVRKDVEIIYKGLLLDVYSTFEGFIEDLFLDLISGKCLHSNRGVKCRLVYNNRPKAMKFLKGDKRYLDWLPYDYTIKRAELYFKDGLPFKNLDNRVDKKILLEISVLRNVLTHDSDYAKEQYLRHVISDLMLTSREKRPMGFLQSVVQGHTRYEYYVHEISRLASKLI